MAINTNAVTTFRLASRYRTSVNVGNYVFQPNVTYSEKNYPISNSAIANAFANGTLTFTDSTSLSEVQSNPVVAQMAIDDFNSSGGVLTKGATAVTPKLRLASTQTSSMCVSGIMFKPGVTYQNSDIKMNDPELLSAMARGFIVFADSNVAATVFGNPIVYELIKVGHAKVGWYGAHNVHGA